MGFETPFAPAFRPGKCHKNNELNYLERRPATPVSAPGSNHLNPARGASLPGNMGACPRPTVGHIPIFKKTNICAKKKALETVPSHPIRSASAPSNKGAWV